MIENQATNHEIVSRQKTKIPFLDENFSWDVLAAQTYPREYGLKILAPSTNFGKGIFDKNFKKTTQTYQPESLNISKVYFLI